MAAWTFRTGHRQGYATVLSRRYQDGGSEHYLLGVPERHPEGAGQQLPAGGQEGTLTATDQAPLFTWVHVALSFDGTTLRLYQDGRPVGSCPTPGR